MGRGDGRIFQRGRIWWLAWCFHGRERRESSRSSDPRIARNLLRVRVGQIAKGERPATGVRRMTVDDVLQHYTADRQNAGRYSQATQRSVAWVRRQLGGWRVTEVTLATLTPWCAELRQRYKSGTLRVHLATLKAAMTSARRAQLIEHRADFPVMAPGAARKGFYSPAEAAAQLNAFTERETGDLVEFLYLTGWRLNEGRELLWTEVDREGGVITLGAERNKNRDGRPLPIVGAMTTLIERRFKARRLGCPLVFHRQGKPITEYRFRSRFRAALQTAKLEPRIPHDLRRSMSRDQIRAGVTKPVAMKNTGHRDASVFDRYDITVVDDQAQALLATEAYRARKSDIASDSRGASA